MIVIVWPLLIFAYYKGKYTLKNWLWFFAIIGAIIAIIGSGEYVLLTLVANIVGIPMVFLSARFTAWCIKRYVNRKKANVE